MKTLMAKPSNLKKWYLVDASGKTLGRLATFVASILKGKGKVDYTPNVDCGDYVVIINSAKIQLTGKKWTDKIYYHHTDYPGGLKAIAARDVHAKDQTKLVEKAILGMLPKTRLGRQIGKKLFVYAGQEHRHSGQKPTVLEVK